MSPSGWFRLTDAMMSGEALEPYGDGVLSNGYMVSRTPHEPGQKMLAVFEGEVGAPGDFRSADRG